MKKIYFFILSVLSFTTVSVVAQCTGCTINITGLNSSNHIVSSGQTMCISPTGTVTGLITVSAGGTLCNQGKINSTNVWIAGGTLKNYGTIDTYSVTVSAAGTFTNYATALIDSLWITQSNSKYFNEGTQTGTAFAVTNNASATNNGTITVYNHADSTGIFENKKDFHVTHDFAVTNYGSFVNTGNIYIGNDFALSGNSPFWNYNYMEIGRDFFNSANGGFRTYCMINVGRDWYNSASVIGGTNISCGGFNISGGSYNTGTIGNVGSQTDICDAGHPALGLDGPGGTIVSGTTYCNCANACVQVITGVREIKLSEVQISKLYPNPSTEHVTIEIQNKSSENIIIEVRDMMGKTIIKKQQAASVGLNTVELNVSALAQGTYILSITDSKNLQTKQLFTVNH